MHRYSGLDGWVLSRATSFRNQSWHVRALVSCESKTKEDVPWLGGVARPRGSASPPSLVLNSFGLLLAVRSKSIYKNRKKEKCTRVLGFFLSGPASRRKWNTRVTNPNCVCNHLPHEIWSLYEYLIVIKVKILVLNYQVVIWVPQSCCLFSLTIYKLLKCRCPDYCCVWFNTHFYLSSIQNILN